MVLCGLLQNLVQSVGIKLVMNFRIHFNVMFVGRNNISFLRLDGTLNQQQRERVIKKFSEENDILVCSIFVGLY